MLSCVHSPGDMPYENAGGPKFPYFAEGYLAEWFNTVRGDDVTIWMFGKSGAVELEKNYRFAGGG